jgi:flagellar biogenesis protein FliO
MKKKILYALILMPLFSFAETTKSNSGIGLNYYIQVLFSLVLVMGLIFLGSKVLAYKFQRPSTKRSKILDFIQLEPQVSIYKVQVDDEEYILGVGNKHIVPLKNQKALSTEQMDSFREELEKEKAKLK